MASVIENGEQGHSFNVGSASSVPSVVEVVNPTPFHNPVKKFDADRDGATAPNDVLATINAITRLGSGRPTVPANADPANWKYVDINGDGFLSPIDVLVLINELRRLSIPPPNYGYGYYGFSGGSMSVSSSGGFSSWNGNQLVNGGGILTIAANGNIFGNGVTILSGSSLSSLGTQTIALNSTFNGTIMIPKVR